MSTGSGKRGNRGSRVLQGGLGGLGNKWHLVLAVQGEHPSGRKAVIFISAQIDTVWRALDSQYKGGGKYSHTDPLGYSKAQNTALINHVDSLVNHSWWAFNTMGVEKEVSKTAHFPWLLGTERGIPHPSSQQRPDPQTV